MKPATNRFAGGRRARAAGRPAASPVLQDRDAVPERHRLGLVVRDVDGRHAELVVQALDLRAHLHAQLASRFDSGSSIRNTSARGRSRGPSRRAAAVRRRAVPACARGSSLEPEQLGASSTRALDVAPCGTLRSAARKRCSPPPSSAGRARSSGTPSRRRAPSAAASLTTRSPMQIAPAVTSSRPGDHAQRRRLAAARRPEQHQELAAAMSRSSASTAGVSLPGIDAASPGA